MSVLSFPHDHSYEVVFSPKTLFNFALITLEDRLLSNCVHANLFRVE